MPDNSKQHGKASGGLIALAAVLALGLGAAAWWLAAGEEAFGGALGGLAVCLLIGFFNCKRGA